MFQLCWTFNPGLELMLQPAMGFWQRSISWVRQPISAPAYVLTILGNVIGSFIAGPLADGLGRKKGMFIANIVVIVGSVIQAAAFHRRDMIVGRVILGIGSVLLGPSAQSYTVEISHPAYRGVMMGLYNGCYFIGAIISTCVSRIPKMKWQNWLQSRAHLWHCKCHERRD